MKLHYKLYPPSKRYQYVSNFLEDLYRLYQDSLFNKPKSKDDFTLSTAITAYLTKIFPLKFEKEMDSVAIQYVFILSAEKYTNGAFVQGFLRPFLANTPWIIDNDPVSKILFYSKISCLFHDFGRYWAKRERKYMMCNVEKVADKNTLLLKIDTLRAVYDPDLVLASNRSITALGRNVLFSPKLLNSTFEYEIAMYPSLEKLKKLVKFLFVRIFAESTDEILGKDTLPDYFYHDNKYYSAKWIQAFIQAIFACYFRVTWPLMMQL